MTSTATFPLADFAVLATLFAVVFAAFLGCCHLAGAGWRARQNRVPPPLRYLRARAREAMRGGHLSWHPNHNDVPDRAATRRDVSPTTVQRKA